MDQRRDDAPRLELVVEADALEQFQGRGMVRSRADDDYAFGGAAVHLGVVERATLRSSSRREETEPASRLRASRAISILRGHDVLHGADPASVGEVEHDAERILVLGLVVGVRGGARSRRLRPAGEILAARAHDLLLRFVEIVYPHPE